jgi:hypothetical protein
LQFLVFFYFFHYLLEVEVVSVGYVKDVGHLADSPC